MKAAFSAEAIGLDASTEATARRLGMVKDFYRMNRPWVAELVGLSGQYGFDRRFLRPRFDYRHANGRGTRGVWCWWTLEAGQLYEARYRTSYKRWEHRFMTVTESGEVKDVTEEEVRGWLSNVTSE